MTASKNAPNPKTTCKTSDRVYNYIYSNIQNNIWKQGERIPAEKEICLALNCSRTSVRTAISKLASLGILTSQQGHGTYVCKDFSGSILNSVEPLLLLEKLDRISIFEFRKIIEVETAALAAMRATFQIVENMKAVTQQMEDAQTSEKIVMCDMQFHYLLTKAANNPLISKVFLILKSVYMKMFEENVDILGAEGVFYHRQIIYAIEIRNPDLARKYMNEHLDKTIQATQHFAKSASLDVF